MSNSDNPHSISSKNGNLAIKARNLNVYYGDFLAVKNVYRPIEPQKITAIIGPSGCGKSTMLRAFNRMNELVPTAHAEGKVLFHGINIYGPEIDPVEIRHHIGMVFQKPNPFPKSIYENIAWGAKINGFKGNKSDIERLVEESLPGAACGMRSTINWIRAVFLFLVVSSSVYASPAPSPPSPI
jgi:phosphate transport system ATP-binding protein